MPTHGSSIVDWTARVFGNDVAERVFAPMVADWVHEHRTHCSGVARAISRLRWVAALALACLVVGVRHLALWRVPAPLARSVLRTIALSAASGVMLLMTLLVLALHSSRRPEPTPGVVLLLLVNAVLVALPLALGTGAVMMARMAGGVQARRWMLCGLTVGVLVLQFGTVGWVRPLLVGFAQVADPHDIDRLARSGRSIAAPPLDRLVMDALSARPGSFAARVMRNEVANRLAWTVLPAAVAVFAWRLGSRLAKRRRWSVAATAWLLPAALLLVPSWLLFSFRLGGEYGTPAMFIRFAPAVSLLAMAYCLRRATPLACGPSNDSATQER